MASMEASSRNESLKKHFLQQNNLTQAVQQHDWHSFPERAYEQPSAKGN